jgi:NADH-quinone oxidoreductase subunit J
MIALLAQGLHAQPAPVVADPTLGAGETVLFWLVAPLMVLAALGLLFVKKAVHAATLVGFVMISLAVLYAAQDAAFLFAAQIVVYTGAVMMLFLFVLMLVGVDSADSLVETIKGQRWVGLLAGLGLAFMLVTVVTGVSFWFLQWDQPHLLPPTVEGETLPVAGWPAPAGLEVANADGNPVGVARLVFGRYVFAFEIVGTLLVTAAVGAILLTHSERLRPKATQRLLSERRVRTGTHVPPLPAPGVFARHNAVDTPALLPDGSPSELSVSRVLRARGQNQPVPGAGGRLAITEEALVGSTAEEGSPGETADTRTGGLATAPEPSQVSGPSGGSVADATVRSGPGESEAPR